MALRPVTKVAGTEPGAKSAAAPVIKERDPVCLHSLTNSRPRHEFLAAETYFGKKPNKIRTQAYLDTLASYCFISERLFRTLKQSDPKGLSWEYTTTTYDYSVAVGERVHTAPVIKASFSIDGFQARIDFGVAPLETFDCILGATFCHNHLQAIDWPNHRMVLSNSSGTRFTVYGDHQFLASRKLDLIIPRSEARKAVKNPGCLLLMIQPVDTTPELISEESDFTTMRSTVSGEWPLSATDKERLDTLVNKKYKHLFEPRTELPPERAPGELFKIQLVDGATPQYRNYYRLSPQQQVALKELVTEYVEAGKMDLCAGSSWGAPVILVPKKDGGWRVVFDYRLLNNVTVKDRYPLPRIDDYLQNLRGAKFFSSLDALDGFHQVKMDPADIDKTAVVTPFGSYVWKVMPMGAANAPAMFQRMMNRVFGHLLYLKVYMDDILVHSETTEQHFSHLEEFFATCERADIRLKRSKCHFFMSKLEWVGFSIQDGQLACTDHLLSKIRQFPRPRTQRENMAFLGLCQFYMRFVPHYAELAAPLTELNQAALKHNFTSYWKAPQEHSYNKLVTALTSAPVLTLFDEDRPIRIETDASDIGMGAALMQQDQQGKWRPVEYWSKKFNTAQQNYHPAEKETCAILYALQHWRHLVFGQQFTVVTDNKASQFIGTKATEQLSPREMRWIEKLAYYAPFTIEYRPGKENVGPDYLSRHSAQISEGDTYCILDLCAGMGTTLRALELVIPETAPVTIDYIAVEKDADCRSVISRVFHQVRLARPGLFTRKDIFRYGNDVKALVHRRKLPPVHLIIAGVPCQPFSRANTDPNRSPLGLYDTRELFTSVAKLRERLKVPDYVLECTPFAPHLDSHMDMIAEWFGEPQLEDLSAYCAQSRTRLCWTSVPASKQQSNHLDSIPLTWQECLDSGSKVPLDAFNRPRLKCPTLMASARSHSDRSRSTWVHNQEGTLRPLNISERERLVGMQIGDTAALHVSEPSRQRMCGNAFPVGWIAHMLHRWLNHTRTLRPLASRSPARTVCGSIASITEQHPDRATHTGQATELPPILDRIRVAAEADQEYQRLLRSPPDKTTVRDGLLFEVSDNAQPALVVPLDNSLRQELLHMVHDQRHFGAARTFADAKRHFTWPSIRSHIEHFVARCPVCQLQKPGNRSRLTPLCPEFKFYPYPFHTVVLDVVENLPLTALGHNAVLTIVDRFTKYAIYIPIHSTWSAHRQAQCIMDDLVYKFHTPLHIHTDNGPAYRALFQAFCTALGIRHVTGTPYHSQSQGGAERQHRTLLQTLRTTCNDKHQWDQYLQAAAHAYNDTVHTITQHSPFELLFGCQSRLPWHLQLPTSDSTIYQQSVTTFDERVAALLSKQRAVYQTVQENLVKTAGQIAKATAHRARKDFTVGDKVKVQYGLKGPTDKHKLDPYFVGPFVIKKVLKGGSFQLDLPPGSAFSERIHGSRLEAWIDSDLTLFPMDKLQQPAIAPLQDTAAMQLDATSYRIRRYLLRDYSMFPTLPVRYWIESNLTDASQRYFWVDETSSVLEEFLPLEENNGCIPEQGITPSNYEAVRTHKKTTYLQSPSPIMINTWPFTKLPYQTRRRPRLVVPSDLVGCVIQELFHIDDKPVYYQGLVQQRQESQYEILWTDGKTDHYQEQKVRSLVYDPVAYVYDFQA